MIRKNIVLSVLLSFAFLSSASASDFEKYDGDFVLAQNTSRGNERSARPINTSSSNEGTSSSSKSSSSSSSSSKTSRNEYGESRSKERPSRPTNERPQRPHNVNHATTPHDSYHHGGHDNHHHHHSHGGGDVVYVVEDDVYYGPTTSSETNNYSSGDYKIDRFMLFANLGFGVSFRGASGMVEYEYDDEDEEDNEKFGNSLGYNVELRFDVGLTKHLFLGSGVGFTKQSIYNKFLPGNYMKSTKRFLDIPVFFGFRKSSDEDFIASVALGPRLAYGLNGQCREHYDFYPDPEYGVFSHDTYGGKYGLNKFSVGAGLEANLVIYRLLLGFDFSLYPNNDCKPAEIYDGLYKRFYGCRTNFSIKAGWRIF